MAPRIVAFFAGDLMGEEAYDAATHTFALKGVSYEVVLEPGTLRADARGFRELSPVPDTQSSSPGSCPNTARGTATPSPSSHALACSSALCSVPAGCGEQAARALSEEAARDFAAH